jgi:spermidine synthase
MSLMPVEIESAAVGIACAQGHVAVLGLGLGWSAALCAMRTEVERVTVVEHDAGVIALHEELGLFEALPGGAGEKVRIIHADAFEWRPDGAVDLLLADIWLPLVSDGRVDEVRRMQAELGARQIYFWGQELEIARAAVAAGRTRLDADDIKATVAELDLPLAGIDTAEYPERVRAAAGQWMNEAWFTDARPDFMERTWHPEWRMLAGASGGVAA